ncbi:MAG: alpha/beta hydrolase [Anaerolineaceae bacterium]
MNNHLPFLEEIIPGSKNLFILFGGIDERMGMPRFEFYQSSSILNENRLFFRDPYQCWYQNGLPGIGKNVYQVSAFIRGRIHALKPDRVVFVGYSMGGYAAIMFAVLTGVGEAIVFSPRTSLHPLQILQSRDPRHKKQVLKTYLYSLFKPKVWDLKRLIRRSSYQPAISLYVAKNHSLDYFYAKRLDGLPNVNMIALENERHDVVKFFRDEGRLAEILSAKSAPETSCPNK